MSDLEPAAPRRTHPLWRRLPLLIVFGLLAWTLQGDRPREIELVYDLPDAPAPTRARVSLLDEAGTVQASIDWGGSSPAADRQIHRPRLQAGTWALEARLDFADGTTRHVERTLTVGPADERIVVHLQ